MRAGELLRGGGGSRVRRVVLGVGVALCVCCSKGMPQVGRCRGTEWWWLGPECGPFGFPSSVGVVVAVELVSLC